MKRYVLAHRNSIDGLELEKDVSVPQLRSSTDVSLNVTRRGHPADLKILINIKALSLNARDLQIVTNDYPAPHAIPDRVVPISGMSTSLTSMRISRYCLRQSVAHGQMVLES